MEFLDVFAIIILLVLGFALVGVWVLLGMMPGRIARGRNHPQADAVSVCGWWGVITMGLLLPVAFIWAYYKPVVALDTEASDVATSTKGDTA
ncbi:DUF3302 domain-containing protein [Aureliella helgolandensis]|uniref:Inner membrane protein YiaW n=1 Tax=Aureliella helgolandensis TaxID=2527968 RepID=A0A518G6I8_9BACT|nr:DUF3302 domain-containing protein [Aureliella helgolandensis]QDV24203.1 Inner membrane protein YiaW [Aureliella helgolandensis]